MGVLNSSLQCVSYFVQFRWPQPSWSGRHIRTPGLLEITTSPHEIIPEDQSSGSKKLKFIRRKTIFGDTGWYGCSNTKEKTVTKDYNDPNASWIYVYVKCKKNSIKRLLIIILSYNL